MKLPKVKLPTVVAANARSEDGSTALLKAVEAGRVETVKTLLEGGADVNAAVERGLAKGMTPLILAAGSKHTDIVKALLEKGADVTAKTEPGRWAKTSASTAARSHAARACRGNLTPACTRARNIVCSLGSWRWNESPPIEFGYYEHALRGPGYSRSREAVARTRSAAAAAMGPGAGH